MPFLLAGLIGLSAGCLGIGGRRGFQPQAFEGLELALIVFVCQLMFRGEMVDIYLSRWAIVGLWSLAVLVLLYVGAVNLGQPGVGLMETGLGLNLLVVVGSGGMPVWARAAQWISGETTLTLSSHPFYLVSNSFWQPVLGDSIPLPLPAHHGILFSVGDLLLLAGVAVFCASLGGWVRTQYMARRLPRSSVSL